MSLYGVVFLVSFAVDPQIDAIRKGWSKLAELDASRRSYTVRHSVGTIEDNGNEIFGAASITAVRSDPEQNLFIVSYLNSLDNKLIIAKNPHYQFVVFKEKGKDFRLALQGDDSATMSKVDVIANEYPTKLSPLSTLSFGYESLRLAGLANDKHFKFKRVTVDENRKAVLLFAHRMYYPKPIDKWAELEGHMILNPNAYYHVEYVELVVLNNPEMPRLKVTCQIQPLNGKYYCKSYKFYNGKSIESFEFSDFSDKPFSDEELYLSYYGLPEPIDKEPRNRRTPFWVWYGIIGLSFLGIAVLLWRRWRMKEST